MPPKAPLHTSVVIPLMLVAVAVGYLNYDVGHLGIGEGKSGALIGVTTISSFGRARGSIPRRTAGSVIQRYAAPDNAVTAVTFSDTWADGSSTLGRVEFRSAGGELLAARDWPSAGSSSAAQMRQLAWTPDSRFFVYSILSLRSGHAALFCYDRGANRIFALDDSLVPPGSGPDFRISARDAVTFAVEHAGSREQQTVSLSSRAR